MPPRFLRFIRKIKRRCDSPLKIPSDRDLSDALFLFYESKLFSSGGESHMLMDSDAQFAFDHVCAQMGVTSPELVRIIGILRARGIVDAKIFHEKDIIQCRYIQLGFSALSFVQETSSRRRQFWLNSILIPIVLAFITALFTSSLSQENKSQNPGDCSNQRPAYFVSASGSSASHTAFME
ncbi:MAG: hypothetical protein IJ313_10555 [Clostridia bacterium]|nr:hypothetical protein [Clostridia bacterium]